MLLYMCLSLPQIVMAQYMTRLMMCKVNQKGHNPWPLMHPCTRFQANLAGVYSLFYLLQAVCCLLFLL